MSQTMPPDREVGGGPGGPDDRRESDHPRTTSNQPLQRESNIGESSGLLFSVYSKAAEEEDNKIVEHWQKDADGILIFTGLFSAAVAALLAVTVMDLRPSSQDISAFYLGNIYQVLADPNVTLTPTPSPAAKPPSFSPPRYAVWVNSLWFLSLVMSLSCALWATSLQQWARRYLRRAQPARCSPEKRARMRAFYAEGVDNMHIPWAVEGLPMLLHLSLFLFFGGVGVFLFNIDREVFGYVIWWIGLFSLVYGLITLLPIVRHDSPYHSPLSTPSWFLYASIHHLTFKMLAFVILKSKCLDYRNWESCDHLRKRYLGWMLGGVEKAAEESATKRSSKIDIQILDWTLSALGDDDSLKNFFEAIPRSFNSKMLEHLKSDIPSTVRRKILLAVQGFCDRTLSSNSIIDSEKVRRLDISNNARNQISNSHDWLIYFLSYRLDVPQTAEMGHTVARWMANNNQDIIAVAQRLITGILVNVQERNDSWITLAARVSGLSERDLRNNIALGGDSVLLAILIHVTRQSRISDDLDLTVFERLSKLDICNTHPRLQNEFCTLWNEIVQEARSQGHHSMPVYLLTAIRRPYIALHQGTDAAPTAFDASTDDGAHILYQGSSYPLCNLASHHPNSTAHVSVTPRDVLSPSPTWNTASRKARKMNNVMEPSSSSNPMTTGEIGATSVTSHGPGITPLTNPAHSRARRMRIAEDSSRPTGASRTIVVTAAPQDGTSTATDLQNSDIVAASAEPGTRQILSIAHTLTPAPIPTSLPNTPSGSYHAGAASVSAGPSYIVSPSLVSSVPASRPTGSATLPGPRVRGLVNTKNICSVNAVLQLLVNSPPVWNLFRELGDLKRQRGTGVPETGGGTTPLVDATARFFNEFIVEVQSKPDTGGTLRADEEKKDDNVIDSFEPTYLYDAMKEKRRLKPLLDGEHQDAEEFLSLYLDALDEECPTLLGPISAGATLEHEVSQSGQARVGSQSVANFIESPITQIFGGKFRPIVHSPNQPIPVPTEDWRLLHLDIQPNSVLTIRDALMRVSQPQSMQEGSSDAPHQMLIEALPPVLVLHLKRFQYDAAAGGVTKISKFVQFSSELEIPFDIMVPNAERPQPPHYKLYGVLYHHGESAGNGHYSVDVLQPNGDGDARDVWLHIDDEAVTRTGHEDVFGEPGEQVADERCAYLFFYCRASPLGSS